MSSGGEKVFMNSKFVLYICIRDLIQNGFYSVEGLANELAVPIDHVIDIVMSKNDDPSMSFSIGILMLHKRSFPEIYY